MPEQTILCPKCGERIAVSKALTQQVEKQLRDEFRQQSEQRDREQSAEFAKKLREQTRKLQERAQKDAAKAAADQLHQMRRELLKARERERSIQATFEKQLSQERASLKKQAQKSAQLAAKKSEAEHRLRESALEKQLDDAKRKAADLKRRLEQVPQPLQGEVAQLDLGRMLRQDFPNDEIEQVKKGVLGGDIRQRVYVPNVGRCGTILWESKDTKVWDNAWLAKLRADQRRDEAEIAVLVSTELPKGVAHFAFVDGVWVTSLSLAPCLAIALRSELTRAAGLRELSGDGTQHKMKLLYEYLASTKFRQRIEAIVEAFKCMRDDLDKERTAMQRHWSKRELQIQNVVRNVAGMYGDMQGIAGSSLPAIRRLELPTGSES